uniref:Vitellogenin n=1 Tax=Romanomermis culicivorax TaxID=13658 RepID=A0A915HRY9_ROMCU
CAPPATIIFRYSSPPATQSSFLVPVREPKIKKVFIPDDRVEPAHFMIKATSTASGASLLLNKQELETNDQKEYIFPTSSTSMYAATNYSMKAKAKTPPTMSTMLTPKNSDRATIPEFNLHLFFQIGKNRYQNSGYSIVVQ